jgi:hypothetical protein
MKVAALLVLTATATVTLAVPTTYPDKTSFLSSIRGNAFANGVYATANVAGAGNSVARSSNGWDVTVTSPAMFTWVNGIGADTPNTNLTVSTNGRPATAASMKLNVITFGPTAIAGTIAITTNAGEVMNVTVPATGAYIGFTTNVPFTSFVIDSPQVSEGFEDLVIGDAADMPNPDNCVGAITVYNGTTSFNTTYTGSDLFGWRIVGNPAFSAGRDVWFQWTAPDTGSVNINTIGAGFDTTLAIYASNTCPNAATVASAFNDDAVGLQSRIITNVVGGQHYFIRVGGFTYSDGTRTGSGPVNIVFTAGCDADFNGDGVVDFFDYLDFVAAFSSGC